ncbi:MAG TPA: hypothetical protein PKA16_02555 [Ottowia sp.]|uniref:hypothetical protein n=1 Tax=Ottowia sp. TaxID=1898956 RepID=UPI002BF23FF6|nr:hypothetical protein [Ottowia sp.]HMN20253.1 hypothetical protein [Ottowia sp.]
MSVPPRIRPLAAQALGFVAGALAGYGLARLLGFDLVHGDWSSNASVLAIAAVGLCGGIGIGAGRRWAEGTQRRRG